MKKIRVSVMIVMLSLSLIISVPTVAAGLKQTIEVMFNSINLEVNGEEVLAENILYNDTTYVPLRKVAEMLGQTVEWDESTRTANITSSAGEIGEGNQDAENQTEPATVTLDDLWVVREKGNVTFYFTPKSDQDFKFLYDEFDEISVTHKAYYGDILKHPIKVYVLDDSELFNILGSSLYSTYDRVIVMTPYEHYEYTEELEAVRYVFAHELAHAYQYQRWDMEKAEVSLAYYSNWLIEGQADYVAHQLAGYSYFGHDVEPAGTSRTVDYYKEALYNMYSSEGWWPVGLEDSKSFIDVYEDPPNYLIFETIIYFLETEYGKERSFKFIRDLETGTGFHDAVFKNYGVTSTRLMQLYKIYYDIDLWY